MRLVHPYGGAAIFGVLFLAGCNGSSDDSESDTDNTPQGYHLNLGFKTVVNGACSTPTDTLSFNAGDSICAVATLKTGAQAVAGQVISFNTDLGTLSPATRLSDTNGIAEVIITNPDAAKGAGTVSASFSPAAEETITSKRNFEYTGEVTPPQTQTPSLNASIQYAGDAVTRFRVDNTVQLRARLVDANNQGIANQKVTFSAGNATLTPNTALTQDSGIAEVSYTPQSSALGAHTMTINVDYQGQPLQGSTLYEVIARDAVSEANTVKLGHFNADNQFVEGQLATTLPKNADGNYQVSAGGTFGITANLVSVDGEGKVSPIQSPSSINFSSDCVTANAAMIDSPVTTLSGMASSTFEDVSCSGNSERSDQIIATTQVGSQTLSATLPFTLARQSLANLSFISAQPANIRIKGAGGTDASESSLVTFKVSSANGQGAAQQQVDFTLDTIVGGLSFADGQSSTTGLTNAQGMVSVRVLAGTVPTPVRVVAKATDADTNEVIVSQSEQLSINTGLPQQLGMSISASVNNPEAASIDGQESTITVFAADSFGNPAPDDTTINFTTEGGQITPQCLTQNGRCSVTWTSANPRVPDHRVTILAYALGHETFFDTNGNNIFDPADGGAIAQACLTSTGTPEACSGNGMDREAYSSSGFSDLGDAFRDDNENRRYDGNDIYLNTAGNDRYSGPDGKFNGPQCEGPLCGTGQANKTYIRKALVLTMSGSTAHFTLTQDGTEVFRTGAGFTAPISPIAADGRSAFTLQLYDSAGQIMPVGSSVQIEITNGDLEFTGHTVPNATRAGGTSTGFSLLHPGQPGTSAVTIKVTTPAGIISELPFNVTLQ